MKAHYSAQEIRTQKTRALDLLDKLEGRGKYAGDMGNICYGDGYFANSIMREFKVDDLQKLRKWASS